MGEISHAKKTNDTKQYLLSARFGGPEKATQEVTYEERAQRIRTTYYRWTEVRGNIPGSVNKCKESQGLY